jgi:hypothetical protein
MYPCLCGFEPVSKEAWDKHRKNCLSWRLRPDPKGLSDFRRKKAGLEGELSGRILCEVCGRRTDHHSPSCPHSQSERARWAFVERAGIKPQHWEWILRAFAKRYGS